MTDELPASEPSATGHEAGAHAVPLWILLAVWAGLAGLTYVTVKVTDFDLGALNLWLAMAIATFKASLVALFFMHLWWDRPINAIVLVGSLVFRVD